MAPSRFIYPIRITHTLRHQAVSGICGVQRVTESYRFQVRTLSRLEFQQETARGGPAGLEEYLLAHCVESRPEQFHGREWDWDALYAGVVEQLKQAILQLSGFLGEPHPAILSRVENYLAGEESSYDLMIMAAFDAYKLEDLLELDNESWHRAQALAQRKLLLLGMDPEAILDPESFQKKQRRAAVSPINPLDLAHGQRVAVSEGGFQVSGR